MLDRAGPPAGSVERLVERFVGLARIDAVSRRERPVADAVRAALEELGLEVEEDAAGAGGPESSGNLICRVHGGGDLAVVAHMDTARPTAGMEPVVEADRIVSDGSTILGADNRAGVAAILHAVERVVRDGLATPGFTAVFTVCEETDMAGARSVELPEMVRMAVVFDSSLPPGAYIYRAYGARCFEVEVRGRASHAAIAPERGVDAIGVAARALAGLEVGRVDPETTVNVGRIEGGEAVNVVPSRCRVEGEVRSLRRDRVDALVDDVEARFRRAAGESGAEMELRSRWDFEPFAVDPESEVCERVRGALGRLGLAPEAVTSPGGSDANALNARGIPAVNVGIGAQNPHADDELILKRDLAATAELVLELVTGGPAGEREGNGG